MDRWSPINYWYEVWNFYCYKWCGLHCIYITTVLSLCLCAYFLIFQGSLPTSPAVCGKTRPPLATRYDPTTSARYWYSQTAGCFHSHSFSFCGIYLFLLFLRQYLCSLYDICPMTVLAWDSVCFLSVKPKVVFFGLGSVSFKEIINWNYYYFIYIYIQE